MDLRAITGLAGVSKHENSRAKKWASYFEWPMLIIALWVPVQWYLEARNLLPRSMIIIGDWAIWSFFVLETVILTRLVNNKKRFLRRNWMNLFIIVGGFPLAWGQTPLVGILRNLRVLLLLGIVMRVSRTVKGVLGLNRLAGTLWVTFLVVLSSAMIISTLDPSIDNPADGLWWAWVTVTTVGYGDVVPSSEAGRLFAALLMLVGVGIFAMLTANLSAFLVGEDTRKRDKELRDSIRSLENKIDQLESKLGQHLNPERQDNDK